MMAELNTNSSNVPYSMNPKKFILWLFMVTVGMLFGAFTSAYLVRREAGNWLQFDLPTVFIYSTVVIIVSSLFMHLSYIYNKKNDTKNTTIFLAFTVVLSVVFLIMQFLGWNELINSNGIIDTENGNQTVNGIFFGGDTSNPAGSFVYVFSGMHGIHLILGVFYMIYTFFKVLKKDVNASNSLTLELCTTYWHFLDILWVFLYCFLLLNK